MLIQQVWDKRLWRSCRGYRAVLMLRGDFSLPASYRGSIIGCGRLPMSCMQRLDIEHPKPLGPRPKTRCFHVKKQSTAGPCRGAAEAEFLSLYILRQVSLARRIE